MNFSHFYSDVLNNEIGNTSVSVIQDKTIKGNYFDQGLLNPGLQIIN